jgi:hypothetical protein
LAEIDPTHAKEALLRSGYLLESRVEAILRKRKRAYYVEANSVFPDRLTGISRELDIHGIRAYKAGPGRFDFLWTVPLIECVNNPEPLVLITKRAIVPQLHDREIQASGIPLKFPVGTPPNHWRRFTDIFNVEKYHHYCHGRIATQYCSFQRKKQKPNEWMAWHDEAQFDSFKKLSHAVEYEIDRHHQQWQFRGHEHINLVLYYPIVVVQGQLMEARASAGDVRLYSRSHLMFRRSEFMQDTERTFQIDVVQEKGLSRLLSIVDLEADRLSRALRRKHREVRTAISAIVRTARRRRKSDLRKVMTLR